MKTKSIITTLFITTISFYAQAQRPNFNVSCKNAMQKLAFLAGDWKGKAVLRDQNGEKVIDQRESM